MRLYYLKDNSKCVAKSTNSDVEFDVDVSNSRTTIKIKALEDITLLKADDIVSFHVNFHDLYFLNGYQSWTDTKEFKLSKRLRNIKKSPHIITHMFAMDKYGDSTFYKYSIRKMHGYDIFYSRGEHELLVYSYNYKVAYLIVELIKDRKYIHLISDVENISLKKGEEITIFDYSIFYNLKEGMASFLKDFPRKDNIQKLFGYTSWYNYYQNINEEIILRDLDALDNRFNVFQIDDGYETFVGDWLDVDEKKFPNGLKPIVDKIHSKGFKAGIWLAPFVAEKNSKLFKEHPEYFKKWPNGKLVKAGGNWSGQYSLDLDKKEVLDYIKKCLTFYMDLGFDFFKLDFLYASALPPYEGRSRAMVQSKAYEFLREVLKDKLVLGCGAHVLNSYNNFDYLRIGPDVSLSFDDAVFMRLFHRERVSTKVTLQNTIYRSFMNRRLFGNDPDVFLLRDENISLSKEQKESLITINALFGSLLMTSDNIATYNDEKKALLEKALELFKHGEVLLYETKKHLIKVTYKLKGEEHHFTYNTKKGVLSNVR
ncbi:MAG: alpha-galactosidase [Bacilli bacterium]|nr:alpha-galactosidase [Bacilli bacterium]